ncbi:MAG: hypothetical protein HAW59_01350, partial [Betaproteobacteria bacterium]|nr:hypothetical protein [Betaproteobacteria bacterium]
RVVMPGTYTLTVAAFLQDGEVADMEELRVEVVEPVAASPIVVTATPVHAEVAAGVTSAFITQISASGGFANVPYSYYHEGAGTRTGVSEQHGRRINVTVSTENILVEHNTGAVLLAGAFDRAQRIMVTIVAEQVGNPQKASVVFALNVRESGEDARLRIVAADVPPAITERRPGVAWATIYATGGGVRRHAYYLNGGGSALSIGLYSGEISFADTNTLAFNLSRTYTVTAAATRGNAIPTGRQNFRGTFYTDPNPFSNSQVARAQVVLTLSVAAVPNTLLLNVSPLVPITNGAALPQSATLVFTNLEFALITLIGFGTERPGIFPNRYSGRGGTGEAFQAIGLKLCCREVLSTITLNTRGVLGIARAVALRGGDINYSLENAPVNVYIDSGGNIRVREPAAFSGSGDKVFDVVAYSGGARATTAVTLTVNAPSDLAVRVPPVVVHYARQNLPLTAVITAMAVGGGGNYVYSLTTQGARIGGGGPAAFDAGFAIDPNTGVVTLDGFNEANRINTNGVSIRFTVFAASEGITASAVFDAIFIRVRGFGLASPCHLPPLCEPSTEVELEVAVPTSLIGTNVTLATVQISSGRTASSGNERIGGVDSGRDSDAGTIDIQRPSDGFFLGASGNFDGNRAFIVLRNWNGESLTGHRIRFDYQVSQSEATSNIAHYVSIDVYPISP